MSRPGKASSSSRATDPIGGATGPPHLAPWPRGGWVGLTASHDRRYLVWAVLEGVVFNMRDCFPTLRGQGLRLQLVPAPGWGAKRPPWHFLLAELVGVERVTLHSQ